MPLYLYYLDMCVYLVTVCACLLVCFWDVFFSNACDVNTPMHIACVFLECCGLGALIRLWHTFPQMPVACLVTCISQMLYAILESARFALLRVSINEWKRSFVLSE